MIDKNNRLEAITKFRFKAKDGTEYSIFDFIYPIGCLYWSNEDTNPSELFGGTWKQITDTFILAKGAKFKQPSGGNEEISITTDNISKQILSGTVPSYTTPKHRWIYLNPFQIFTKPTADDDPGPFSYDEQNGLRRWGNNGSGSGRSDDFVPINFQLTIPQQSFDIQIGKEEPDKFSIMPPYQSKYCFERIA